MRRITFTSLLLLAGCASAATSDPADSPARVITAGETLDVRVAGNDEAALRQIDATAEEAWRVLPQVFEALEIPVSHIDTRNRIIGNREHRAQRTLGGEQLERFLSCGSTMTGPVTSSHRVMLSVVAQVLPAENGLARLRTLVEGVAHSRQGVSGAPISCASSGRLEARIAEMVNRSVRI
jgi:hypothetical protein